MNIKISICSILLLASLGACGSEIRLEGADSNVTDVESLRRGVKYFVDYCAGCHAMKHLRYSRIAEDLNLTEQDMKSSGLMAPEVKFQDSLEGSMHAEDSSEWLGVAPPDLSLISRARGTDWLFTYLKGFYVDGSRPIGSNNIVLSNVGMPNVLWQLQGLQEPVFRQLAGEAPKFEKMKMIQEGTMTSVQFDQFVNDLVSFLAYAAEPSQFQRVKVGRLVLLALIILSVVMFKLKKEYWRDLH